jgi:hypothetical protein
MLQIIYVVGTQGNSLVVKSKISKDDQYPDYNEEIKEFENDITHEHPVGTVGKLDLFYLPHICDNPDCAHDCDTWATGNDVVLGNINEPSTYTDIAKSIKLC